MLREWLKEQNRDEMSAFSLLYFYETEDEKQEALTLLEKSGLSKENGLSLLPPVNTHRYPKLAASCEISRTPTFLFFLHEKEVGRVNRPENGGQLRDIVESIREIAAFV